MRERPILFSTPMVLAILAGRKTQTRRVVKMDGIDFFGAGGMEGADWNDPSCWGFENEDGYEWALADGDLVDGVLRCPYGIAGDRLWCRETAWYDDCFGGRVFFENGDVIQKGDGIISKAPHPCSREMFKACGLKCKPSIFMPRWASRLLLEITEVRVQRLQEISERDACAEGVEECSGDGHDGYHTDKCTCSFSRLWDKINAKRGFGWDANPWVRAIGFKRVNNERDER